MNICTALLTRYLADLGVSRRTESTWGAVLILFRTITFVLENVVLLTISFHFRLQWRIVELELSAMKLWGLVELVLAQACCPVEVCAAYLTGCQIRYVGNKNCTIRLKDFLKLSHSTTSELISC